VRRKLINIIATSVIIVSSCTIGFFGYPLLYPAETRLKVETLDTSSVSSIISASVTQNYLSQSTALGILNSTIRVGTADGQASGVIVFSKQNPKDTSVWISYILTNAHVVKNHKIVTIETFNYLKNRQISGTTTHAGRVIAKSKSLDLAIIETTTTSMIDAEAPILTYEELEEFKLYSPIYISACPLGNSPFITNGNIAHITKDYYLVTAFSIFGSSGGGVFTPNGKLLGLAAKIGSYVDNKGTPQPLPHLSHIIPINVVAEWLAAKGFKFILEEDGEGFSGFLESQKAKNKYFR